MSLFGASILAMSALGLAAQAHTMPRDAAHSFSVPAFRQPARGNLADHVLYAYAKHNITPTMRIPAATNTLLTKNGSVPAFKVPDAPHWSPVEIGGQAFNLTIHTTNSDLWISSAALPEGNRAGHNCFNASLSPDFQRIPDHFWELNDTFDVFDGIVKGDVGKDTVKMGGELVLKDQIIQLANAIDDNEGDKWDGSLGLGIPESNTIKPEIDAGDGKLFSDNLKVSLNITQFAAYLPSNATGAYDFGALQSGRYDGDISWAGVMPLGGFWIVFLTQYGTGSKIQHSSTLAVIDTTFPLLVMVDDLVKKHYASVTGAFLSDGNYVFPCDSTIPKLSFMLGKAWVDIPGELLVGPKTEEGENQCVGLLQSSDDAERNLLGLPFFNAYYGIFNMKGPRFGWAQLKHETEA